MAFFETLWNNRMRPLDLFMLIILVIHISLILQILEVKDLSDMIVCVQEKFSSIMQIYYFVHVSFSYVII